MCNSDVNVHFFNDPRELFLQADRAAPDGKEPKTNRCLLVLNKVSSIFVSLTWPLEVLLLK